tara:strand:+ start:36 stop:323 length:288 start_codon:yes stop_codon:yes gene_type:complete
MVNYEKEYFQKRKELVNKIREAGFLKHYLLKTELRTLEDEYRAYQRNLNYMKERLQEKTKKAKREDTEGRLSLSENDLEGRLSLDKRGEVSLHKK